MNSTGFPFLPSLVHIKFVFCSNNRVTVALVPLPRLTLRGCVAWRGDGRDCPAPEQAFLTRSDRFGEIRGYVESVIAIQ